MKAGYEGDLTVHMCGHVGCKAANMCRVRDIILKIKWNRGSMAEEGDVKDLNVIVNNTVSHGQIGREYVNYVTGLFDSLAKMESGIEVGRVYIRDIPFSENDLTNKALDLYRFLNLVDAVKQDSVSPKDDIKAQVKHYLGLSNVDNEMCQEVTDMINLAIDQAYKNK